MYIVLTNCVSPWYDRHGWLVVKNQLYTHGGWAHRQRVSTTFLTRTKITFAFCSSRDWNLGPLDLESDFLPIEPSRHPNWWLTGRGSVENQDPHRDGRWVFSVQGEVCVCAYYGGPSPLVWDKLTLLYLNNQTYFVVVTVHEKTRYIGHFGGNEALAELISMQPAEWSAKDRTALSRTDWTLSSLVNLIFSKKENKDFTFIWALCQIAHCDLCLVFLYRVTNIHIYVAARLHLYTISIHPAQVTAICLFTAHTCPFTHINVYLPHTCSLSLHFCFPYIYTDNDMYHVLWARIKISTLSPTCQRKVVTRGGVAQW